MSKTNSATMTDERGVILSKDALYWFQPIKNMHSQAKRPAAYRVIRRADKSVMVERASSVTVAARLLARVLAS